MLINLLLEKVIHIRFILCLSKPFTLYMCLLLDLVHFQSELFVFVLVDDLLLAVVNAQCGWVKGIY
jgi:hypothetical protein